MANYVWFVPGFMGSTLGLYNLDGTGKPVGPSQARLWGDLISIARLPLVQFLALPTTAVDPRAIVADGIAPSILGGYTDFLAKLQAVLAKPWQVAPWPYDWRQSAKGLGTQLATALIASAAAGNTNYVVGHSYGALVIWCAWASLVDQAQTSAITRIITFGGALYGSSATPSVFREQETSLAQLATLQRVLTGNFVGALTNLAMGGPTDAQAQALLQLTATWPSVVDLFPDINAFDDPGDSARGLCFLPSAWSAALAFPSQAILTQEIANVHNYVRQAKYVPPATMSAHLVGGIYFTPWRTQQSLASSLPPHKALTLPTGSSARLRRLVQLPSFSETKGDGRCTVAQQSWPGHYTASLTSRHADQQNDPGLIPALYALLMTATIPQPPAPSAVAVAPVQPPAVAQTLLTAAGQQILLLEGIPATGVSGLQLPAPTAGPPPTVLPVRTGVDP